MVFDRRFNAASPRYLGSASNAQQQSDGLRPPLQDYCVLLTRSFLMVLGRCRLHLARGAAWAGPTTTSRAVRSVSPTVRMCRWSGVAINLRS